MLSTGWAWHPGPSHSSKAPNISVEFHSTPRGFGSRVPGTICLQWRSTVISQPGPGVSLPSFRAPDIQMLVAPACQDSSPVTLVLVLHAAPLTLPSTETGDPRSAAWERGVAHLFVLNGVQSGGKTPINKKNSDQQPCAVLCVPHVCCTRHSMLTPEPFLRLPKQ